MASAADIAYRPQFPVASYIDAYGDERIIHAPRGPNSALRRFKGGDTPALKLNRAVAVLFGQRIKARRAELGLTAKDVAQRAGSANVNAKQFLSHIERAVRREGVRFGTLYALAHALECEPFDLMPSKADAMALAGVVPQSATVLA